jgi:hypothetical protein
MSKQKKRRHRLGGPSSQNVAVGQRKLIVHTVARDPNVQLRINPAGVEKMSDVLLRFAEPILDRLATASSHSVPTAAPSLPKKSHESISNRGLGRAEPLSS